jgi:hypothetical protein
MKKSADGGNSQMHDSGSKSHRQLTVGYMIMTDVVKEEPAHPAQKGPVNRGSCTAEERPFSLPIMRNSGV